MGQVKLEKPEDPQVFCSHTEMRDPASLVEHPRNYNTHPAEQIRLLAKIIKHQGWRNPITVSKRSGYVVKGHGRLAAALQLGCSEVPVDVQEYKDEASEYADMIADNRIAELAEADQDALKGLLTDDVFEGFDLDLTGFDNLDFLGEFDVEPIEPPDMPEGDKEPFRQVTFTLHDQQHADLESALKIARDNDGDSSNINENKNGNSLAWICERIISHYG